MIQIEHLTKSFGSKVVLDDISATFETGKIIGLLGPNGAGKTTFLKILAGVSGDYKGVVRMGDSAVGPKTKAMTSYSPDCEYLPGWMNLRQITKVYSDYFSDFDSERAFVLAERFRLDPRQKIKNMSKGMQEKIQLALTLSRNAKIYLLDEPIGGVDPASRAAIMDLIIGEYRQDALMIIATHLVADIESIFDQVVFMDNGKISLFEDVESIRMNKKKSVDALFKEVFACSAN